MSPGDGSGDCETGISKTKGPLWKSRNSHRESATIRNASAFSAERCAVRRMTGPKNALGGPFPVSSHASGNPRLITQSVPEPSVPGSHGIDRSEQTSAESFWDNSHKGEFTNDRMARDDVPDCFRRSCLPPYSNNATGSETGREFWPEKSDFEKKGLSKSRQDMFRDHQQANGTASNHQPSDSVETAAGLEFTPSLSWQTKAIPPLDRARDQRNSAGNAL